MEENCWPCEVHVGVAIPEYDIFGRAETNYLVVMMGIRMYVEESYTGDISGALPFAEPVAPMPPYRQYRSPDEVSRPTIEIGTQYQYHYRRR